VLHTPDFFVIAMMRRLGGMENGGRSHPARRTQFESVPARRHKALACLPGEAYAGESGLYYRVRSAQEIDWVFQRNVQFLDDYLRADCRHVHRRYARGCLATSGSPGLSLETLFDLALGVATRDEIYSNCDRGTLGRYPKSVTS